VSEIENLKKNWDSNQIKLTNMRIKLQ